MADRQIFKSLIIYLELKPLFYSGRYKMIRSRINEISIYLGISPRSLRSKLKILHQEGFITYTRSGDLQLCNWDQFHAYFDLQKKEGQRYKYFRLKNQVSVEMAIRQLIIEENFKTQNKAIDIKIFQQEIIEKRQIKALRIYQDVQQSKLPTKDKERLLNKLQIEMESYKIQWRDTAKDPEFKKFKSSGKLAYLYVDAYKAYERHMSTFGSNQPFVNPIASISCAGIARLYGLKSKASGHYWEQKFKQRNQAIIRKQSIFCPDLTIPTFNWAVQNTQIEGNYFWTNKGFFRRLNNAISFTPLVTA